MIGFLDTYAEALGRSGAGTNGPGPGTGSGTNTVAGSIWNGERFFMYPVPV